jgi:solute carrier family 25 (mitochondrial citrate transporter), member 1
MSKSSPEEKKIPPLVSLLSGGIAGGIEAASTYPFEFAKTRVQLRNSVGRKASPSPAPRNPFLIISNVFREEGIRALYKGCSTLIVGSIAKDGVRFLSFDTIKNAFKDPETGTLTPLRNMLAGMTSGVFASIFAVTPTERIKTALIDDARNAKRFHSPLHAVAFIYRETGLLGLYRGFAGNTLKQASATAFRMGTYNILKDYESTHDIPQTTATNFANGSVAGIVTTYATMPFDTIKTRSQSARGASTVEAVRSIWIDGKRDMKWMGGVRGFWRGTTMRLGRTVFSGGILFTVYERVAAVLNPLFGVVE